MFEQMLPRQPESKTILYSLLIAYALVSRCDEVMRIAGIISRTYSGVETKQVQVFRQRLPHDCLSRMEECLASICETRTEESNALIGLILAELSGDQQQVTRWHSTVQKMRLPITIT
jgi:hypothetical protein